MLHSPFIWVLDLTKCWADICWAARLEHVRSLHGSHLQHVLG